MERGRGQQFIYERRLGPRLQVEGAVRSVFDSLDRPFDGVTAAVKYNVWHSLERRALASSGLEATPPLGRQTLWELEPFFAIGANPRRMLLVQGEVVGTWEETEGITAFSYRLGVGLWIRVSRLGHVAGSVGVELPAVGPEPRHPTLIAFVLWDYGDAPLFRGW